MTKAKIKGKKRDGVEEQEFTCCQYRSLPEGRIIKSNTFSKKILTQDSKYDE